MYPEMLLKVQWCSLSVSAEIFTQGVKKNKYSYVKLKILRIHVLECCVHQQTL